MQHGQTVSCNQATVSWKRCPAVRLTLLIARHLFDSCSAALLGAKPPNPRLFVSVCQCVDVSMRRCVDVPPQAVDHFINGDYYRHPLTAEAILGVALELRVRAP